MLADADRLRLELMLEVQPVAQAAFSKIKTGESKWQQLMEGR
jgi:hypothetical protein